MTLTYPSVRALALVCLAKSLCVVAIGRDPCESFVCQNGGSCTAPADAPSCLCAPGFFGDRCEYNRDPCYNNFGCLNGGQCTAPADAPYCVCPDGFTGEKCGSQIGGQCPNVESDGFGICGGQICDNDTECGSGQKCCRSNCGGNLCTNVTTPTDEPVCSPGCPEGHTCEYKPVPCAKGMVCPAIVVPTCVPPQDSCGGCPDGQVCQLTGVQCIRAPCPEANKCVAVSTPKPPVACNLACRRGYECQLQVPTCPFWNRRNCSSRPVPTCVPKCPRTNGSRRRCPRWWKPRNTCSDDNDCRKSRNQRCCPSRCEWDVCTNVGR